MLSMKLAAPSISSDQRLARGRSVPGLYGRHETAMLLRRAAGAKPLGRDLEVEIQHRPDLQPETLDDANQRRQACGPVDGEMQFLVGPYGLVRLRVRAARLVQKGLLETPHGDEVGVRTAARRLLGGKALDRQPHGREFAEARRGSSAARAPRDWAAPPGTGRTPDARPLPAPASSRRQAFPRRCAGTSSAREQVRRSSGAHATRRGRARPG